MLSFIRRVCMYYVLYMCTCTINKHMGQPETYTDDDDGEEGEEEVGTIDQISCLEVGGVLVIEHNPGLEWVLLGKGADPQN